MSYHYLFNFAFDRNGGEKMESIVEMKLSSKNIVSPKGFKAAGINCELKHKKKD